MVGRWRWRVDTDRGGRFSLHRRYPVSDPTSSIPIIILSMLTVLLTVRLMTTIMCFNLN